MHTILRLPTVMANIGLSRSGIYFRLAEGTFPKPVSLGAGPSVALSRTFKSGSAKESN
jgi:predicted DNA-binding transcriptional regulator AlpA